MVYYNRFLKTPRFEVQKKQVFISALICITTDLGDDFLSEDVDLVAIWARRHTRERFGCTSIKWQAGARQLPIQMPTHRSIAELNDNPHPAVLEIYAQDPKADILGDQTTPLVISGCSDFFRWPSEGPAEKFIKREFHIGDQEPRTSLRIWEETGNSIARHIW